MSEKNINSLREELRHLREEERKEKKESRIYWKRRIATAKQSLTEAEKLAVQLGRKPTIRDRMVEHMDNLTLRICAPFEVRAAEIRYKRSDPQGYEADQIYKAAVPVLDHVRSKIQKGKQLSNRELEMLGKLHTALGFIVDNKLGTYHEVCLKVLEEMSSYFPVSETVPEEVKEKVNNILKNINSAMQTIGLDVGPVPAL